MRAFRRDAIFVAIAVTIIVILGSILLTQNSPRMSDRLSRDLEVGNLNVHDSKGGRREILPEEIDDANGPDKVVDERVEDKPQSQSPNSPSSRAMVFYYSWYGNPDTDGEWIHWNHRVLVANSNERFTPPVDIGANFYPLLGPYSSKSRDTIDAHMKSISTSGIGCVVLSWWGRESADEQGGYTDKTVGMIMDAAARYGIKIAFHLEPYKGRNAVSTRGDVQYINEKYGRHPAYFTMEKNGIKVGLFYVYDSYITPTNEWKRVLPLTDAVMIGLMVTHNDKELIQAGGFDGFYTYFATPFTWGANPNNWNDLQSWASEHNLIFIPCVGPGYDDRRIRPWNAGNTKSRQDGRMRAYRERCYIVEYYDDMWQKALSHQPAFVGITSYNEWHEGTQIEEAVPAHGTNGFVYSDYMPHEPDYYMTRTHHWITQMSPSIIKIEGDDQKK